MQNWVLVTEQNAQVWAVETAGVTGEEQPDRRTVNEESDHTVGDDHHARCAHPVVEAGSIVSHVSNDMNEGKRKTVKKQARQQQQKRLRRFQKRRGNPKTH